MAEAEQCGKPHRSLELLAESASMDFAAALKPGGAFTDEKLHLGSDEGYNYWCFQQVFACFYSDSEHWLSSGWLRASAHWLASSSCIQ